MAEYSSVWGYRSCRSCASEIFTANITMKMDRISLFITIGFCCKRTDSLLIILNSSVLVNYPSDYLFSLQGSLQQDRKNTEIRWNTLNEIGRAQSELQSRGHLVCRLL